MDNESIKPCNINFVGKDVCVFSCFKYNAGMLCCIYCSEVRHCEGVCTQASTLGK